MGWRATAQLASPTGHRWLLVREVRYRGRPDRLAIHAEYECQRD